MGELEVGAHFHSNASNPLTEVQAMHLQAS